MLTGRSETDWKETVKGSKGRAKENWVHPLWPFSKKRKKMLFNDMPGTSVFIIAMHFRRPYQTTHIIRLWLSFPSLKIYYLLQTFFIIYDNFKNWRRYADIWIFFFIRRLNIIGCFLWICLLLICFCYNTFTKQCNKKYLKIIG